MSVVIAVLQVAALLGALATVWGLALREWGRRTPLGRAGDARDADARRVEQELAAMSAAWGGRPRRSVAEPERQPAR